MLGNLVNGSVCDGHALSRGPNAHDPLDLVGVISHGGDDEHAGEEVRRDAVSGDDVVGAPDRAHTPIGSKDDDGGDG